MSLSETAKFDGLAPYYHWMETVLAGRKLERCRNAFLTHINNPQRVLLVGEGHGKFLAEIVRRWPQSKITCLDVSAGMIAASKKHLKRRGLNTSRTTFLCGNLFTVPLEEYDLIATHFLLDCLTPEQLAMAIAKLASHLRPGGRWMLSDFQLPASGWKRLRAQCIHWLMYRFFRAVTDLPAEKITNPVPLLERNGVICINRREFDWGLLHAELWEKSY